MKSLFKTLRLVLAVVWLISAAACTQVKLGTMWTMRDVDLLVVDPAVMRVAIELPGNASFSVVSVAMKFTREGSVLIDENFDLEVVTSGLELLQQGLPRDSNNLVVLRVPESHIADLINFQNQLASEQNNPRGSQASFGLDSKLNSEWVNENCAAGMQNMEISAWILIDRQQGYLPLLEDSRLGKLLDAQSDGFCGQEEL